MIQVTFSDQPRLFRIIYNSILFCKGFQAADGQSVKTSVSLKVSVKRDDDRDSADVRGTSPFHPPATRPRPNLRPPVKLQVEPF